MVTVQRTDSVAAFDTNLVSGLRGSFAGLVNNRSFWVCVAQKTLWHPPVSPHTRCLEGWEVAIDIILELDHAQSCCCRPHRFLRLVGPSSFLAKHVFLFILAGIFSESYICASAQLSAYWLAPTNGSAKYVIKQEKVCNVLHWLIDHALWCNVLPYTPTGLDAANGHPVSRWQRTNSMANYCPPTSPSAGTFGLGRPMPAATCEYQAKEY